MFSLEKRQLKGNRTAISNYLEDCYIEDSIGQIFCCYIESWAKSCGSILEKILLCVEENPDTKSCLTAMGQTASQSGGPSFAVHF